jgi:alpha-glucosidase (family GH31 glycosyl hydrolase)
MVTPILEKGVTSRNVYFPESNWYDLHEGKKYKKGNQ